MKNYYEMSDFEINNVVHNVVNSLGFDMTFLGNDNIEWSKGGELKCKTGKVAYTKNGLHDYCNNVIDAWPIIFGNEISICAPAHCIAPCEWWAEKFLSCYTTKSLKYKDKNPLRAAMIVYLMMKDEK